MSYLLDESNAQELTQIARETGALVLRGQLRYPGPETGDWEVGAEVLSEALYGLRGREVVLILAAVGGREPVHLCGVCGFELGEAGEECPRCALVDEDVAAAIDGKRVAEGVEEWLSERQGEGPPHPLEVEMERLRGALGALEACPPVWWADRLLWRGLRWFYRMRVRRIGESLRE